MVVVGGVYDMPPFCVGCNCYTCTRDVLSEGGFLMCDCKTSGARSDCDLVDTSGHDLCFWRGTGSGLKPGCVTHESNI